MLQQNNYSTSRTLLMSLVLLFTMVLCFAASAPATTHAVLFGGSAGFAYSPASFSAHVGDTVKWSGSFSSHPLSSATIPSGAATWHVTSGSLFTYVITIPGVYNYICDLHASGGMIGSFTVTGTGVLPGGGTDNKTISARLLSSGKHSFLQLTLQNSAMVSGTLLTLDGREGSTIVSARMGPGVAIIPLTNTGRGFYILRINAGKWEWVKKIVLNTGVE